VGLFKLVALFISVFLGYTIVLSRHTVYIDKFVVPEEFEKRGYTSQTVTNRIRDALESIDQAVKTRANKEHFDTVGATELPEIEIPDAKLSLNAIVELLPDWLHLHPRHVYGEITTIDQRHLLITIRATHTERGLATPLDLDDVTPEVAIVQSAREVMHLINPYLLALFLYQKDPKQNRQRALDLTYECEGRFLEWGLLLRGDILADSNRVEDAMMTYRHIIEIDSNNPNVYNNQGILFQKHGMLKVAIASYEKAICIDPTYAAPYKNLALALQQSDDVGKAIDVHNRALLIESSHKSLLDNLDSPLRHFTSETLVSRQRCRDFSPPQPPPRSIP